MAGLWAREEGKARGSATGPCCDRTFEQMKNMIMLGRFALAGRAPQAGRPEQLD